MIGPSTSATETSLTADDQQLIETWRSYSSWIWTVEDSNYRGSSPSGEQRAFRKTYVYPDTNIFPGKIPETATIVMAADDYFALYVDGVLRHEADPGHDWSKVMAFNFPLSSAADGSSTGTKSSKLVLGIRVINVDNFAGLKMAGMIHFNDSSTTTFVSGQDDSWLGEKLFQEGWERPDFAWESQWKPAAVCPSNVSRVSWPEEKMQLPQKVLVFGPAEPNVGGLIPPNGADAVTRTVTLASGPIVTVTQPAHATGASVRLSPGQFAGALLGAVALSMLVFKEELARGK
ncbi:hypothetical protein EST38_g1532 [Candolleomyces aberdarensis]|uniref:Uncharacterized protein n=1 Tax=Candolleomyces aberdarensis TaxID=2316362 RepID=A0A4Q2DX70_9AGAR|nr:hypothetical protein EST38_g1532 [Candolleomyces aberdarensis]